LPAEPALPLLDILLRLPPLPAALPPLLPARLSAPDFAPLPPPLFAVLASASRALVSCPSKPHAASSSTRQGHGHRRLRLKLIVIARSPLTPAATRTGHSLDAIGRPRRQATSIVVSYPRGYENCANSLF
jgi:hypothetical protein